MSTGVRVHVRWKRLLDGGDEIFLLFAPKRSEVFYYINLSCIDICITRFSQLIKTKATGE